MDINKRPGSRLSGTATTESGKTYNIYSKPKSPTRPVASPAKPASPMPEGTPRGIVERQKWERFQFKKHGNPYVPRKQIYSEIDRITNENQEALFAHVFGNQYRYEDRNALDPQAQAAYRSALLKFRKNVQDAIMADIKEKQAKHQERMGLFDKYYGKDKPKEPEKPKEITGVDQKRLFDAIGAYEKNPTPEKFMVLKDMASSLGYDLGVEAEPEKGTWDRFKEWVFGKDEGTISKDDTTVISRAKGESIDQYLKRVEE